MSTGWISRNGIPCGVLVFTFGLLYSWGLQMRSSDGQALPSVICEHGDTSCTVSNYIGEWPDRSICKAAKVWYPTCEQEIIAAVANAVQNGQKIKAVSQGAHSIPKLVCPGGDGTGVLISTRDLTENIVVDSVQQTVTVDAGVQIKVLFDNIAQYGLAFPVSPLWAGVSISGALGTGAHGSTIWGKGSSMYAYVVGMRLVVPATAKEGFAKVVTLVDGDEDLNAAKVSLGVLGVISSVTLQLEPMFKRSVTIEEASDANLETQLSVIANRYEFGDALWFPSLETVYYRKDNRVDVSTPGTGTSNHTGFIPTPVAIQKQLRASEEAAVSARNSNALCESTLATLRYFKMVGFGFTNDGTRFEGYPVIGYQNSIGASGTCQYASLDEGLSCAWDPRVNGIFYFNTALSVSLDVIGDFIRDVKALVKNDPSCLCGLGLYTGILMRFVKKSDGAYLGQVSEAAVDMDLIHYRARDPKTPRWNEDTIEEIEQMLIFKYGGQSHWGKNRPVAFLTTKALYPDLPKFLAVKNAYDPDALFSNDWTDAVLNVNGGSSRLQTDQPYCALEGLCICSEDIHCAPEAGYFCRPGIVYTDARVCRFETSSCDTVSFNDYLTF